MKIKILISLLRCLSVFQLSTLRKLGSAIGGCCWLLSARMVETTKINLELCFSELDEAEREDLAKESIKETLKTTFEMAPMWLWPQEKILASVQRVEGFDILQAAHAESKGVIVIAPHIGNWELLGPYLDACGCGQISVMFQAPKSPALGAFIYTARSRGGSQLLPANAKGVGKALCALRKGEIVGILPDQVPPLTGGEYVNFFGVRALTMTLLSRLLIKTGAKAVLAYAKRVDGPKSAGFIITFKHLGDKIYAGHMQESLQAMNDAIEASVRELPEQYQWEYKRFKRQPEGSPSIY